MVGWHHRPNGHESIVNSGSWWWTGRPGVLQFMGLQRVRHNWVSNVPLNHLWFQHTQFFLLTWFSLNICSPVIKIEAFKLWSPWPIGAVSSGPLLSPLQCLALLSPNAPRKGPVISHWVFTRSFLQATFPLSSGLPQPLAFTALRQYCFSVQSLAGLSLPLYHELRKATFRVALFLGPQSFLQCLSNWWVK